MSFFRSERMFLYTIILHPDSAFDCIIELGYAGAAQLLNVFDGNVVTNAKYNSEVQRCIEMLRIIKRLQEETDKIGMRTFFYPNVDEEEIPREKDLQYIETTLSTIDTELIEVMAHCDGLQNRKFELIEHRQVLLKMQDFLTGARNTEVQITSYDSMMFELLHDTQRENEQGEGKSDRHDRLSFITGSIALRRFSSFETMVWRVSRGNAHMKHAEFELPEELAKKHNQLRYKQAFIIVFVGKELEAKLLKICQGYHVKLYACPETQRERKEVLRTITRDLEDLEQIFAKSCEHKKRILAAATTELYIWRSKVRKMHDAYYVLNRLGNVRELRTTNEKYLQADCWIPKHSFKRVRGALMRGAQRATDGDMTQLFPPILHERIYPEKVKPPTYFRTNKFTGGFQNLIDAYGMAAYRELNPAPYTIITFPFLFAIMFGDAGHGLIVTLYAWFLIHREKRIQREQKESTKTNEIFNLIFGGRYILLLMGIFSIYTGLIYNDLFSRPLNLFGSSWQVNFTMADVKAHKHLQLDPARPDNYRGVPYVLGVDPVWNSAAENAIIVTNSLKMKISIILGVFQMLFGLSLSAWNALYTKTKIDFYFVFLPQMTFFLALFFYLVFLIFFKWYFYGGHNILEQSAGCAPSILITFINMVLMKDAEEPLEGCKQYMFGKQPIIQRILLFVALLSVPILLCGKPIHFMLQKSRIKKIEDPERKNKVRRQTLEHMRKSLIYSIDDLPILTSEDQEEQLSEVWIHSGIHTIECVLGSVSHTASYLRLWALSLAHAQLSHVLWKMVLSMGLRRHGYLASIFIYFSFAAFAALTVCILIIMEGLSAFLHTLRLHWVEFQSKFYKGTGDPFQPFHFKPSCKMDTVNG